MSVEARLVKLEGLLRSLNARFVTDSGKVSNGGGGVTDHALLTNLTYAAAAHTGFAQPSDIAVDANLSAAAQAAITASHAKQHAITTTADHTSAATPAYLLKADANGLPTTATNTDAAVAAAVAGSGKLTMAGQTTIAGASATTITINSLNLGTDKHWIILMRLKTTGTTDVTLTFNADTTATNYTSARYYADGATLASARYNAAYIADCAGAKAITGIGFINMDVDGSPRTTIDAQQAGTNAIIINSWKHYWLSTANITSVTLTSLQGNTLVVGSQLTLFKVAE